jgi:hypothetical protein
MAVFSVNLGIDMSEEDTSFDPNEVTVEQEESAIRELEETRLSRNRFFANQSREARLERGEFVPKTKDSTPRTK